MTETRETTPMQPEVPDELIQLMADAEYDAPGGCSAWDSYRTVLAAVYPAIEAIVRAQCADEIEADFRENVNDAGINIDADRIISARAWGMYRAARIARGRRP